MITGMVAGTFPQSLAPSSPDHPPNTTARTSIASSKPVVYYNVSDSEPVYIRCLLQCCWQCCVRKQSGRWRSLLPDCDVEQAPKEFLGHCERHKGARGKIVIFLEGCPETVQETKPLIYWDITQIYAKFQSLGFKFLVFAIFVVLASIQIGLRLFG